MNIVLTGFMGTGKSAAGKLLAKRLKWQYLDTDEMIEKDINVKISDIFKYHGEARFRELESKAIKLIGLLDKAVIACGGGVVLKAQNMDELEKNGVVVCLSASPEKILERTKDNDDRPLLKTPDPLSKIKELLKIRAPFYKRCSFSVDTDNLSVEQVVDNILNNPTIKDKLMKDNVV
ncbi:MAG: shikimate kinase [Elusimicrobia bacterium]|nr:shikimate kinase [Candidatus Liberimonas magnetica]